MVHLQEVRVGVRPLERFRGVVPNERLRRAVRIARRMRDRLSKRVVWNVSSTAVGGGVAEILQSLLVYTRAVGIDSRWIVIEGSPDFFRVTKRIHHALHGSRGDGSALGSKARETYESQLEPNGDELASQVRPGDIVLLHDPQTAGLAPALALLGARVIWRCHVGADEPNEQTRLGWAFLEPYLQHVSATVFSRAAYVPDVCDPERAVVISPSIDVFSPKNQELSEAAIRTLLVHTGLVEGPPPPPEEADHCFVRDDGTPGRVGRRADLTRLGRAPHWETPLVVQISRWDPLKDMSGVMEGFARFCHAQCPARAELVLAGPNVKGVVDDPEGATVLEQVQAEWRELPHAVRNRVHLACLPTADIQENGAIVNALQRHASVIVQKSLHEGFGLTVTEGMWKSRPVIGSAVGGIQDQIEDGKSGLLLEDPRDLAGFADLLCDLLCDPDRMQALGNAAHERVRERFLGIDHLMHYADVIERVDQS